MRNSGRMACVPVLVGLLLSILAPAAFADELDDAVLAEINFARANPADYARELRRQAVSVGRGDYSGNDPEAVEEAIDFLQQQPSLPPLKWDDRVAVAANQHTRVQGPRGDVGHGAAGGLGRRLQGAGVWAGMSAENISYGYDDARDVVRQLIIDSGVPTRGHRHNIFGTGYQLVGVSCGAHRAYGAMCTIDFAGALAR
jgi:uncharacterized protein YkwD